MEVIDEQTSQEFESSDSNNDDGIDEEAEI